MVSFGAGHKSVCCAEGRGEWSENLRSWPLAGRLRERVKNSKGSIFRPFTYIKKWALKCVHKF